MMLVSMVLTDAFVYHGAGFLWFSPIHIPSGRWFEWFSQMHFPMLTDIVFYRDAVFLWFSQTHFSIMTLCFYGSHKYIFLSWRYVSMVLTDAFFHHSLGVILANVSFRRCAAMDKAVVSGSGWLREPGATSKGWLRTRAVSNS